MQTKGGQEALFAPEDPENQVPTATSIPFSDSFSRQSGEYGREEGTVAAAEHPAHTRARLLLRAAAVVGSEQ